MAVESLKHLYEKNSLCHSVTLAWFSIQILVNSKTFKLQHAKKVVSDSPGLVDFAIGLVNSVFNLPNGQVRFFEEFE